RVLAQKHLAYCREGDLVIYDRGYPSFGLMVEIRQTKAHFLMRCKHTFNQEVMDFVASTEQSVLVQIKAGKDTPYGKGLNRGRKIQVRLVKVTLDNGEVETLVTS